MVLFTASFPSRTAARRIATDLDDGLGVPSAVVGTMDPTPTLVVLVPERDVPIVLEVVRIHGGRVEGWRTTDDMTGPFSSPAGKHPIFCAEAQAADGHGRTAAPRRPAQ